MKYLPYEGLFNFLLQNSHLFESPTQKRKHPIKRNENSPGNSLIHL